MHLIEQTRTIVLIVTTCLLFAFTSATLQADEKRDAFQPNAPKKAEPQKPINQLQKIFQGLFGQPKQAPGAKPTKNSKNPNYYRFPQDLEQERRFKSAQKLIEDQEWEPARDKLQLMLENSINLPVHVTGSRTLVTDRELIYQLLELLPAEQREKFNRQYEALAEKLLIDALSNQARPEIYAEIATRFATTASGFKAMNYLASYHIERGEFGLAEQYIKRLLKYHAPITESIQWRTKAAFVLKQTGKQSLIAELLNPGGNAEKTNQSIKIGGILESPQDWLNQQKILNLASNLLLDEWPMLFGSPNHSARAKSADPLLIHRWSFPLTSNHSIQSQLKLIQEDLTSSHRATIPALSPLAINGKIVIRTLKGVQVLDSQTGIPLWESAFDNSPESAYLKSRLKGANQSKARGLFDSIPLNQTIPRYNGTNPDTHPLTSFIYRNANWGSQSSDGQRLFIIEGMQLHLGSPGSSRNFNRFAQRGGAPATNLWSSNQIVAYDLQTGQPIWKVGGVKFDEPFDLPLAGTFFFGAPTPAGNEIYVVGERDREIRVYALDPQTGEVRWSQQIGNPDQDIAQDMVRRWWIAPVAVEQGVLVCPTNIGLLTAIDRLNHSILWSTQYVSAQPNTSGNRFNRIVRTPVEPLNQRWSPSAPIISGNKVIYTPPDDRALICLNLITGTPCWTKRVKENSLCLAGVVENQILLIGSNSVTAISLLNGKTTWKTAFDRASGHPSGQPVIADQRLHVPLQSGQVWTIDIHSGKILNKLFHADSRESLGNLIIHRGQFLSLTATGLVSYEQKQTVEAEILQIKQQKAQSSLALFKESELFMMSQRYQDALAKLQQIDRQQLPEKYREHFHELYIDCLTSLIRSDFKKYDLLVNQLRQRVNSDRERIDLQRLLTERHLARKQLSDALKLTLELAKAPEDTIFQTSNTETQIDGWIAGKTLDIWNQAAESDQQYLSQLIDGRAQQIFNADLQQKERFLLQFGFHDASIPILNQLIQESLQSGRFYQAELYLTRLIKHKNPQVAAQGLAGIVDLCLKFKLNQDAVFYLDQLARFDQNLIIGENQTIQQFLEQKRHSIQIDDPVKKQVVWRPQKLKLIVGGASANRYYPSRQNMLNTSNSSLPFFQSRSLVVHTKENRLTMVTPYNSQVVWSTPLRSSIQHQSTGMNESEIIGHNLILQHRNMLHFFDLVDQKLIWSQKLEKKQTNRYYTNYSQSVPPQLGDTATLIQRHHPSVTRRNRGMIAAANADYTCYYNRRKIVLIETRTGKVRWTHNNVDQEFRVLGDEHLIYLVTPDRITRKILRVSDGQQMDPKKTDDYLKNAIYQSDSAFVSIASADNKKLLNQKSAQISLSSYQPHTKKRNWNIEFSKDSQFGIFSNHFLSVLNSKGEIFIVDLRTGKKSVLESIPQADLKKHKQFYLVSDGQYIYFVAHSLSRNSISVNVPKIPLNGMLFVFDRRSGKRLWNQSFKDQHLVLGTQNKLPVILLVAREFKNIGNRSTSIIHLHALDKRTGDRLLTWKAPLQSNIKSLSVDYQQKMMEIQTYNARIRLYDADELADRIEADSNSKSLLEKK